MHVSVPYGRVRFDGGLFDGFVFSEAQGQIVEPPVSSNGCRGRERFQVGERIDEEVTAETMESRRVDGPTIGQTM